MSYYPASRRDRICTLTACIVAVLLMLGVAVVLSGCETFMGQDAPETAATPTDQWYQARATLTGVQNLLLIGHQQGVIDDETLVGLAPLVQTARQTLTEARGYLPEGGDGFDIAMKFLDDYLSKLTTATAGVQVED